MAAKLHDLRSKIREGCRGGSEQFKWGSIKDQEFKDREEYLGATMKIGMQAKFGRYYIHDWYAKKRDEADTIANELDSVKAYEEELMQEALGLKPKKLLLQKKQLSEEELKEALAPKKKPGKEGRDQLGPQKKIVANEFGEQVATSNEDFIGDTGRDSIKGLGFAMHRNKNLEEYKAKTLGTTDILGTKDRPIKVEDFIKTEMKQEIGDHFTLGGSSSSSKVKKEEDGIVKEEYVKEEIKQEGDIKQEDAPIKEEVQDSLKREREDDEGAGEAPKDKKAKKDKKDKKKEKKAQKKAEKKLKKAQKKMKKQEKREQKANVKRSGKKAGSSSSSSSSS